MKQYKRKKAMDIVILLCSIILGIFIFYLPWNPMWSWASLGVLLIFAVASGMDYYRLQKKIEKREQIKNPVSFTRMERLILLDEQEKPIKSWDMVGKTAFVIGRTGKEVQVDIDLEDCEYSSLIDFEHAALNFCMNHWYVEILLDQAVVINLFCNIFDSYNNIIFMMSLEE